MAVSDMRRNGVLINVDGKPCMLPARASSGMTARDIVQSAGYAPETRSLCQQNGSYVQEFPSSKVINARNGQDYFTQMANVHG